MSTNPDPYGVDPEILQYSTLTPRSAPGAGLGFGSPREFTFKEGQPLDSTWIIQTNPPQPQPVWTIQPHDGYLRFQTQSNTTGSTYVSIARPFSLSLASVTIAFKIRVNEIQLQSGGIAFSFAPSLQLNLTPQTGGFYAYEAADSQLERLGPSNVKADGSWHRIVINIQPGVVQIWEDDQLVVTWTPVQPLDATIQAYFGVETSGATASIDMSDVVVLVGSTQRARLRMAVSDQSDFERRINYLNGLISYIPNVLTAAKPLLDMLHVTSVRVGDLFWGTEINGEVPSLIQTLRGHESVSRFTSAAKTGAVISTSQWPVLYIGVNTSASFVIGGSASIGFLIGSGPDPYSLFAFTIGGGLGTNASAQVTGEVGVCWMPPRELLGWGSSLQVDFGEVVQGSFGVSGNMPLHLIAFDNCGPSVTMGGGVSALPGDVAGAITYTWNLAQI